MTNWAAHGASHVACLAQEPLQQGLFWVVEEMPGLVIGADQTDRLREGYFASYNIPFYPEMFEAAGYKAMYRAHGTYWTFDLNPRAEIFRRDQGAVEDLDSLKKLMRSNKYITDPYAFDGKGQDPLYAVRSK